MFEGVPQEVVELLLNECSHQGASVTEVAVVIQYTGNYSEYMYI